MTKAAPRRYGIGAREAVPPLPRDPSRARCTGLRCPARRARHWLVYLDQARIHQAAELGHGGGVHGECCHLASSSPGLAAKASFYRLYLYNEGQVRLWPYPRANGEHTRGMVAH